MEAQEKAEAFRLACSAEQAAASSHDKAAKKLQVAKAAKADAEEIAKTVGASAPRRADKNAPCAVYDL